MEFPRFVRVRQRFPHHALQDIPSSVGAELKRADPASSVAPGASVAIGVGSRGISNIDVITRAVVDYWRVAGRHPFLFPAMGSHGAATAAGQADVLAHYGITEATMGCPVRSQLDVVSAGTTPEGIETWIDRLAFESGGIMLVGRVKWHTDFAGSIESGLFKMMAIGLGKFAGAQRYHTIGYRMGMEEVIRSVGRQILSAGKMVGGLAVLEDAHHQTAKVAAVRPEEMESREEELLELAKSWMPKLPVPAIDILVVDEIGKHISGAGMDTKVVNRNGLGHYNPWPDTPTVERILVRSLSPMSYGNAVGIGMADMTTDRAVEAMDHNATAVNSLTASILPPARVPMHFPSDRECLEKLAPTVGKLDLAQVTYCRIRNSLALGQTIVSENLIPGIEENPVAEIVGTAEPLSFDKAGNLKEDWEDNWPAA